MDDQISIALPSCIQTMKDLLASPQQGVSDVDAMRAWEADFTLYSHSTLLAEAIAQDTLHISAPLANTNDRDPCSPHNLQARSELLQSMRNMQLKIRNTLQARVNGMQTKPRLYRLADRLSLTELEIRAFVFIILTCTGMDGPPADERRQTPRPRSELFTCRQFANMDGHQLLHFLSPSRKHFVQGLLEVDEEFAAMYTENRFRAPREVLKAIYGCTLTLDEAMTFGNSALSSVLSEEPGSIQSAEANASRSPSSAALATILGEADDSHGIHANENSNGDVGLLETAAPSVRDRTTDNSAVLELLSELRFENDRRFNSADKTDDPASSNTSPQDMRERPSDIATATDEDDADIDSPDADGDLDAEVYEDDMDYLKDGFDVVQEACKVYNFREKNSEEDRYTNTKRPVEALQREADAKLRKASALFMRRLSKSKAQGTFTPRLELLVDKLKLAHFERMVILTLGRLLTLSPLCARYSCDSLCTWRGAPD